MPRAGQHLSWVKETISLGSQTEEAALEEEQLPDNGDTENDMDEDG
jgi:hypothetical protein